jgi:hypothetical protein
MTPKRRTVEIFSAGCPVCQEAIELVREMACDSCEVTVQGMSYPRVAARAKELGVRSLPAVVVDGRLADCCEGRGLDPVALRSAGIGIPLP